MHGAFVELKDKNRKQWRDSETDVWKNSQGDIVHTCR